MSKLPEAEEHRVRGRLGEINNALKAIVGAADGRSLTKAQAADFRPLHEESVRLRTALGEPPAEAFYATDDGGAVAKRLSDDLDAWGNTSQGTIAANKGYGGDDWDRHDGRVRVLSKGQKLADLVPPGTPGSDVSFDQYVKAVVTGNWRDIDPAIKTMAVGSGPLGGYLVPDPLSAQVIDRARNLAVVFRAGAQTVPMDSATLTIARVAGDPTAEWHAENAALTASDVNLEAVILRSKTVACLVKGSVELFEDSANISNVIENATAQALALELDRVALAGSGAASEPLGIRNQVGVTTTGSIGAPASYVAFADTPTQTLREANAAEPYSFIAAPRTFGDLDVLVTGIASDLTRLKPPPAWDAYQRFSTNQVSITLGAGAESEAYVGDFTQLIVGMRTGFALEASRQAGDASGSAFGNLQVWLRAYLRADIALAHPSHFNVLTGITT